VTLIFPGTTGKWNKKYRLKVMKSAKFLICIAIFSIVPFITQAQVEKDTMAFVQVFDAYLIDDYTLSFDLNIRRKSERWYKLANGTFQFYFGKDGFPISSESVTAEVVDTQLPLSTQVGSNLPDEGYLIEPKVFDDRVSITVLGPDTYEECELVPFDTTLMIGRFVIRSINGQPLPDELVWKEPYDFYQACAFKLEVDSLLKDQYLWYEGNDNVKMEDEVSSTFIFVDDNSDEPVFKHENFWVYYTGDLIDSLGWRTTEEYRVNGFTILRGIRGRGIDLRYTDTIMSYKQGSSYFREECLSKGNTRTGHLYGPEFDTVQYRGGDYCYALWVNYIDSNGVERDEFLEEQCVTIPNAVISRAVAYPNPFSSETKIDFTVDDDVYLTVAVYDLLGKKVKNLQYGNSGQTMERMRVEKGDHYTTFRAPELASQGLFDIVFIAHPINDPSVEISRAVVKVQYIKDGTQ
jgi:hypothetical protein